jgi:hypothetical protein
MTQSTSTPSIAEMMAELDAIAAERGIVWTGAEQCGAAEPVRTRYRQGGDNMGGGRVVRKISDAQLNLLRKLFAERDTTGMVLLPGAERIETMSLAGARDLIDRLMARPMKPGVAPADAPSEKQLDFAVSLAERKGLALTRADFAKLSRRELSARIDDMKALADKPKPAPVPMRDAVTEAGMYRTPNGEIFKVQKAVHGSGQLYAKRLAKLDQPYTKIVRGKTVEVTHEFEYAQGAIRKLTSGMRMTKAEAVEYGTLYGVCCVCAATLTDEKSIEAGIGPVCAGRV